MKALYGRKFAAWIVALSMVFLTTCKTVTSSGEVGADRRQLLVVSEAEMEQSSAQSYNQTIADAQKAHTLNTDKAMTERVRAIAARLEAQTGAFRSDAPYWDWQVNVITETTVNAWCMPGGRIVVYTGIIRALKLTDGELAAVMGHEIAHALKEHSRERASQEALKNAGIQIASKLANLDEIKSQLLSTLAQYTITLPFSRSHETEADHMGTELMARAGYDPQEAVNVWQKMASLGGTKTPEIMSTHPSDESRIKDLTVIAAKVRPLYERAISG